MICIYILKSLLSSTLVYGYIIV